MGTKVWRSENFSNLFAWGYPVNKSMRYKFGTCQDSEHYSDGVCKLVT